MTTRYAFASSASTCSTWLLRAVRRAPRTWLLGLLLAQCLLPALAIGTGKKNKMFAAYPTIFKFFMFWWCLFVGCVMVVYVLDHLLGKYRGPARVDYTVEHTFRSVADREVYWAQLVDPSQWKPSHPVLESADIRMVECGHADEQNGHEEAAKAEREAEEDGQEDFSQYPNGMTWNEFQSAYAESKTGPTTSRERGDAWTKYKEKQATEVDAAGDTVSAAAASTEAATSSSSSSSNGSEDSIQMTVRPVPLGCLKPGLGMILRYKEGNWRAGLHFCTRECTAVETPGPKEPWRIMMRTVDVGGGYPYLKASEEVMVELHPPSEDGSMLCALVGRAACQSRFFRWWSSLQKNSELGAAAYLEALGQEVGRAKKSD